MTFNQKLQAIRLKNVLVFIHARSVRTNSLPRPKLYDHKRMTKKKKRQAIETAFNTHKHTHAHTHTNKYNCILFQCPMVLYMANRALVWLMSLFALRKTFSVLIEKLISTISTAGQLFSPPISEVLLQCVTEAS